MGASLARTQLKAIFGEILRTIPDIETGEPGSAAAARGMASVTVRRWSSTAPRA
jgi:cytochrome P450